MIPFIIIVVVAAIVLLRAVVVVPAEHVYVLTRLGRFQKMMMPGFHVATPFIDAVAKRYSLGEQSLKIAETAASSDGESSRVEIDVRYRITDAEKAYKSVDDVENAVRTLTATIVKEEAQRRTRDQFLDNRGELAAEVMRRVNEGLAQFGLVVTGCSLR